MRYGRTAAFLVAAALAGSSAPAQNAAGAGSETQERLADKDNGNPDMMWNLLGLIGIVGLTGLWRATDNDGYTNDPV